jgi:YHS domain-containing protein
MRLIRIIPVLALTLTAIPAVRAQDAKAKPAPTAASTAAQATTPAMASIAQKQAPSYPLTTCVACGKALAGPTFDYVKDNHLFRLHSADCRKAVDADPAGMWKKVEAAVIAAQKPTYPMKTSAVSDAPLDASAVDYVSGTRLVRLANSAEVAAFEKDPATAMAKVDKALIAAQLPTYAMKTCPVSKEELGKDGEPVNYLHGTKLVRFCCKDCVASFQKDPDKYLKTAAAK